MTSRNLAYASAALLAGALCGFVDLRTTEVTSTLVVLLFCGFVLGLVRPRRFWLFALILGACVPLAHVAGPFLRIRPAESDHMGGLAGTIAVGAFAAFVAACGAGTGALIAAATGRRTS